MLCVIQPGDALLDAGEHVALFWGWAAPGQPYVIEECGSFADCCGSQATCPVSIYFRVSCLLMWVCVDVCVHFNVYVCVYVCVCMRVYVYDACVLCLSTFFLYLSESSCLLRLRRAHAARAMTATTIAPAVPFRSAPGPAWRASNPAAATAGDYTLIFAKKNLKKYKNEK